MVDQTLMTVFIALTALAVLIQTAILAGLYFVSTKISGQADKALDMTRNIVGPLHTAADSLQDVSARIADTSLKATRGMRKLSGRAA